MRTEHPHPNTTVYVGDCREAMQAMRPKSVHCLVTSPPYWALRDYGIAPVDWEDGERCVFGLEATVEGYVRHTLEIFRGIDRVLRDDGVVWWNLGDTFAGGGRGGNPENSDHQKQATNAGSISVKGRADTSGVAPGNKLLIPYRVAIALQDAGWVIREDVQWAKPSPMPISVDGVRWMRCRVKVAGTGWKPEERPEVLHGGARNRSHAFGTHGGTKPREGEAKWQPCPGCRKCEATGGWVLRRGRWRPTTSHEAVLMVTKPGGYFCDAQAAAELAVGGTPGNVNHKGATAYANGDGKHRTKAGLCSVTAVETRNPRSVWRISSEPLTEKHFAAYPSALAWKCIQASTSSAGCCPACGAQYAPMVTKERVPTRPGSASKVSGDSEVEGNRDPQRHIQRTIVHGYRPTCDCNAGDPVPAVVFDPFIGSGTTAQVAVHSGRVAVGCEMSEQYLEIQSRRIPQVPRCFAKGKVATKRKKVRRPLHRSLFAEDCA